MIQLPGVPVLLYHGLDRSVENAPSGRERKYALLASEFQSHLVKIRHLSVHVVLLNKIHSVSDLSDHDGSRVVITFDDGLASNYEVALPLLLEATMSAEFFVNTSTIDKQGFLTWKQISEMSRLGMSFQSHSHDHIPLVRISTHAVHQQLTQSKQILEDKLGYPVEYFSAPYGFVNNRIIDMARDIGYRAVCTSRAWPAQAHSTTINRISIERDTHPSDFVRIITRDPTAYLLRVTRSAVLSIPKRTLLQIRPSTLGVNMLES